ncbi:MAG TPA: 4a-hydroxytetrahydrobiopterin dehydratase [Gemmatimonadaceae bacterium]|jgi:4a-hydroxytetrahydrobiopterin dehydratase|nr:4a-hydroxytetrahydrobiopterin dehydratase [Gemmatimonadaceae bacterium]
MRRTVLPADALNAVLDDLPHWEVEGDAITKTFTFHDFRGAIAFVNRVAEAAERMDHHPDLDIRYNRVVAALSTHDAGGITEMDVRLAREMDGLASG